MRASDLSYLFLYRLGSKDHGYISKSAMMCVQSYWLLPTNCCGHVQCLPDCAQVVCMFIHFSKKGPTHWKRLWCWERLRAGREGGNRGWDGWVASLTPWTWVWVNSRGYEGQESLAHCNQGVTKTWTWLNDSTTTNISLKTRIKWQSHTNSFLSSTNHLGLTYPPVIMAWCPQWGCEGFILFQTPESTVCRPPGRKTLGEL